MRHGLWFNTGYLLLIYGLASLSRVALAQGSLWQQLHGGDLFMDALINLAAAVCASLANTAFRLKNADVLVTQLFKELLTGIAIGLTAGLITWSLAQSSDASKFLQLALVTLAGWGGAKVLESHLGKYFGAQATPDAGKQH